ncbi:MAG: hypothetical protein CMQ05_04160 [Gammaproteobacteria bacterium]|nr:hypothetical protein [Gammaproteobacteria bacterium]RPG23464.1 MAG: hypothetical protein CBC10_014025 [Gammaproteobacteria bacterium TMED50]
MGASGAMMATDIRYTADHFRQWREEGFILIEDFFRPDEYEPVLEDFETMYADCANADGIGSVLVAKEEGAIGSTHPAQFKNIDTLPYMGSEAINMISLHPALIQLSRALLGVDEVSLYQSHTWAKYTGEADYDQGFHCDFGNHTLTVPSDDVSMRCVDFILYLTDVTDETGALHYVTRPDCNDVLGEGRVWAPTPQQQQELLSRERSGAGRAGTLLAHSIDTFHRGTNLTEENGRRFTMTVGYKARGNEMISFHVWQSAANRPWDRVINHGSAEQLACLGIPEPGDAFWTDRTLRITQARWPDWDMASYFDAAGVTRGR